MRLRMILFAAFGVLLLTAIGIVIALATVDFGRFKGPLAAQVAQATGRALSFEGEVSLRLFPRPSLTVKDATLANAEWGSRPHMLRVGLLTAEVEVRIKKRVKQGGRVVEMGELAIQFGSLDELNGLIDRLRGS